MSIYSVREG